MSSRNKKIRRFRRPFRLNMGVIAFLLIAAYIIINCIIYWQKPRISVYEVVEKSISNDYSCTGIVLRDEKVVRTTEAGYLNYYYADGTRIKKKDTVYTLDESGKIYELLRSADNQNSLSKNERKLLWENISDFRKEYQKQDYSTVQDFVYDVQNTVLEISTTSMGANVKKILQENDLSGSYYTVKSDESGILSYFIDGYEDVTADQITEKDFHSSDYEKHMLRTTDQVKADSPAYKLVTGEDWSIVLELSEEVYQQLKTRMDENLADGKNTSYMTITLSKEDITVTVPYTLSVRDGAYFATVTLSKYVIHYIDDRFIDVEISLNSAEGLKIPTTSILKKKFYVVPSEYLTQGGDDNKVGLIKEVYDQSGEVSYQFVAVPTAYEDEDGNAYIETDLFSDGEWIRNQSNQERYQIGKTKKLKGVYNINLGYCLFRRVKILYENEEYCIVDSNTTNGLSAFDHIIVDAKTVTEDDLINNYKGE